MNGRARRALVALAAIVLWAALAPLATGCTTTGGVRISRELLKSDTAQLAYDPDGVPYVVVPPDVERTDFLVVERAGTSLAYFVVPVTSRIAQLLPLSPTPTDRDAAATDRDAATGAEVAESSGAEVSEPVLRFVATLDGEALSGSLGVWSGGFRDPVRWLGPEPRGRQAGILLTGARPERGATLPEQVAGHVVVEETRVMAPIAFAGAKAGPYFVVPDGPVRRPRLRVANFTARPLEAIDTSGIAADPRLVFTKPEPRAFTLDTLAALDRFALLELGRRLGVDALVVEVDGKTVVALTDAAQARIGRTTRLEATLANEPLALAGEASDGDVHRALRALRALRDNHPLLAGYYLREVAFEIGDPTYTGTWAAALARHELVAAAGFGAWARASIVETGNARWPGLANEAEVAVALAESDVFEREWAFAAQNAHRARIFFDIAPQPHADRGRARAHMVLARAQRGRGEHAEATESALEAAAHFERAGDVRLAAHALVGAAHYALDAGDRRAMIEAATRARNLLSEADARYHAGLVELALVRLYVEIEHYPDAMELALQTEAYFEEAGEPVAHNQAKILQLLARQQAQPGFDATEGLIEAFERARELEDHVGAMYAAVMLVRSGKAYGDDESVRYGAAIVAGLPWIDQATLRRDGRAALTAVCTRGLPAAGNEDDDQGDDGDVAALRRACETTRAFLASDPRVVAVWLGNGYRHVQMEQWDRAEDVVAELEKMLTPEFVAQRARRAADILLLAATVSGATVSGEADALVARALALLDAHLDPLEATRYLRGLSEQFRTRGIDWLAVRLAHAAIEAATARGQTELERDHTVYLARLLYETGRLAELVALARTSSDASVNTSSEGLALEPAAMARLFVYEAAAHSLQGDAKAAERLSRRAFELASEADEVEHLAVLHLAAKLALERDDAAGALAILERARAVEEQSPAGLVTSEAMRIEAARGRGLQAAASARLGRRAEADALFGEAVAILSEFPTSVAPHVRIEVLLARGLNARDEQVLEAAAGHLELLRTQLDLAQSPEALRQVMRARARLALARGDAGAAREIVQELFEVGLSPYASRARTDCLAGRAALLAAGEVDEETGARLSRCVAGSPDVRERAEARLLLAIASAEAGGVEEAVELYRRELAGRLLPRDVRRLELVARLSAARQKGASEAALEVASQAGAGVESEGEVVRLRTASMLHQLRPLEARTYLERALAPAPDIAPEIRAEIELLRAQHSVVLGQWHEARRAFDRAAELAAETTDRRLRERAGALARRFELR